jgi:drug/metabolite transporter (DMT)-like permease
LIRYLDSLKNLDLGEATVITFLTPILANLMSSLFLKTPLSRTEQAVGVISLIGVIFIAKPASFLIQTEAALESPPKAVEHRQNEFDLSDPAASQRLVALLVALLGACGSAVWNFFPVDCR